MNSHQIRAANAATGVVLSLCARRGYTLESYDSRTKGWIRGRVERVLEDERTYLSDQMRAILDAGLPQKETISQLSELAADMVNE